MPLRDDIFLTIRRARDADLDDYLVMERIMGIPAIAALDTAAVTALPEPMMTDTLDRPSGIDQGITRLALSAFIVGAPGPWNGVGGRWVRYRGHQIARDWSADGYVASTTYLDNENVTRTASWLVDKYPLSSIKMIDELLDVVIEHHGVPGDEVPDAEATLTAVVAPVDASTADRVLAAWEPFVTTALAAGTQIHKARGYFLNAIRRGEVQP